jgi:hypothetical protein
MIRPDGSGRPNRLNHQARFILTDDPRAHDEHAGDHPTQDKSRQFIQRRKRQVHDISLERTDVTFAASEGAASTPPESPSQNPKQSWRSRR